MTPLYRLYPALLVPVGVNRTRPGGLHKSQATAELKQAIAETSLLHCAARRDRREEQVVAPFCRHSRHRLVLSRAGYGGNLVVVVNPNAFSLPLVIPAQAGI